MAHESLDSLKNEEFLAEHGFHSNPKALYSLLKRSDEVDRLKWALRNEEITEQTLDNFVAELLQQLEPGELFPYDITLAAIAVALEKRATDFAETYILDLAKLNRSELPMAIRVAREAAKSLAKNPANKTTNVIVDDSSSELRFIRPGDIYTEPAAGENEEVITYGGA